MISILEPSEELSWNNLGKSEAAHRGKWKNKETLLFFH